MFSRGKIFFLVSLPLVVLYGSIYSVFYRMLQQRVIQRMKHTILLPNQLHPLAECSIISNNYDIIILYHVIIMSRFLDKFSQKLYIFLLFPLHLHELFSYYYSKCMWFMSPSLQNSIMRINSVADLGGG